MIDMKQTAKEITRDQAQTLNPLIDLTPSDTMDTVNNFIGVLQDYLMSNKLVELDSDGLYIYLKVIQAALSYEGETIHRRWR